MDKVLLNKQISVLCLAHRKKTEEIVSLMCQYYARKIQKSRRKNRTRIRRRMAMAFKLHSRRVAIYMNIVRRNMRRNPPKTWMKRRSSNWWRSVVNSENFEDWIENFRLDKSTYLFLCEKLRAELQHSENYVRKPLSVEMKVAIALYKLASCSEYRVVANQFGVHKASVHRSLKQFCAAVVKVLLPEEIKIPNMAEAAAICNDFELKSNIPMVWGAIDGCHIPVKPPAEGYRDYINRKSWASVILQGIVDAKYRFIDVTLKHPGCTHDAVVLKDSFVYKNINTYERPSKLINGKEVKAFLVGDPAYPLQNWLIKGYISPRNAEEESFNVYLNKARIVVENAFGRLKGRWRMIQKRIDTKIEFVPLIVATCCVLHNIAEKRKLPVRESWIRATEENERIYPQPRYVTNQVQLSAPEIRDHLKEYMFQKYPLLTSHRN